MLKSILLVGLGGAVGSILRYLTTEVVNKYWGRAFPLATFTINILGCFLIGILAGLVAKQPWLDNNFKLLFITGFCGGYTTFSTFALENVNLLQGNNCLLAFLYIGLSIFVGIIAALLGMSLIS